MAVSIGQLTADAIDDIAVSLAGAASVLTPLAAAPDTSPPSVTLVSPDATDIVRSEIESLVIQFSEDVLDTGPTGANSVTNLDAYKLFNLGPNGVSDHGGGDDLLVPIANVAYDPIDFTVEILVDSMVMPFVDGNYQLTVAGSDPTSAIVDRAGNLLLGGVDAISNFVVNTPPASLEDPNLSAEEGAEVQLTLNFRDPGFLDHWTANIDWGDGTKSDATVLEVLGEGTVAASHVYANDGTYVVSAKIVDSQLGTAVATGIATIANVPAEIVPSANDSVLVDTEFAVELGKFSDPGFGPGETYNATVDWGDGTVESAEVTVVPGAPNVPTTGTIRGSHSYDDPGSYSVVVTLHDGEAFTAADFVMEALPQNSPPAIVAALRTGGQLGRKR